ncbi:MAG: GerMN domain-containing protein [Bacteroidales bacterium]|nr:GerMN domain-containing protein [Bacteroidales bacterium]MCM1414641.1 GerMN domain-containing protein [bacterium]MCM1424666.1 GerMN domain-containing protein [bacterium]
MRNMITDHTKKRKKSIFCLGILLAAVLVVCCACAGGGDKQEGMVYQLYYVNNDESKVISREYRSETTDDSLLLEELLQQLAVISERLEYETPLAKEFTLMDYTLDNGLLTLDFDERYRDLRGAREVLVRASIVRTVTQVKQVESVAFTVKGEQLVDQAGVAIGVMNADSFIENAGNEINAYEKVDLRLYFANESGDYLVEESRRNVVYNSNISLEKLVVEKLVEGPMAEGAYPTINPATKVLSVTVKDGTCYVNLSGEFLNQTYNVTSDVTIYSITNSLVELTNVNRVQIAVDGETDISYREKLSLNNVFERDLDMLESTGVR